MASEKVSALTEASSLTPNDTVYVVQDNVSKKAPISKFNNAIKLHNVEIPGIGYETSSTGPDGRIWLYDRTDNLANKVGIDTDGISIRGERSGDTVTYHEITWDQLVAMGTLMEQDDEAEIFAAITNTGFCVVNKEHEQEFSKIGSDGLEFYDADGHYVNLLFPTLKSLQQMVGGPSGVIKSNEGYYFTPSSKKPEGVVVELYQYDLQHEERTDTLIQGAKYRSDGIEYYNGNGSIGFVAGDDLAALLGLGSYTGDLATLLQDLDDRITALENA